MRFERPASSLDTESLAWTASPGADSSPVAAGSIPIRLPIDATWETSIATCALALRASPAARCPLPRHRRQLRPSLVSALHGRRRVPSARTSGACLEGRLNAASVAAEQPRRRFGRQRRPTRRRAGSARLSVLGRRHARIVIRQARAPPLPSKSAAGNRLAHGQLGLRRGGYHRPAAAPRPRRRA